MLLLYILWDDWPIFMISGSKEQLQQQLEYTLLKPTTPSLSQTIWPRWASRQFLTLSIVQTLLPVTFDYSLSSEAVVMRQLRRWKRLWRRSLTRWHKRTSMRPSRSCWNGTTSVLQPEEITSKGTNFMCVLSIKVPIRKKSVNLFNDPRISWCKVNVTYSPKCNFIINIKLTQSCNWGS